MRIGIVCPYSVDVPGGVQLHVRDLAEYLLAHGHEVSVLAPADEGSELAPYVVSAGRAVPIRYNGSVARLSFGPLAATRVNRWLAQTDLDLLHIHEPMVPSVSLLALWATTSPVVATFHTSGTRMRALQAAYPLLRPSLEKISARIAVSEDARRTVTTHVGGDAVVIPNGVEHATFASASPQTRWSGRPGAPTVAFLGRVDEPRKGLPVLLEAWPEVLRAIPGARLLVAGPGNLAAIAARLDPAIAASVELLGAVTDEDKAALLSTVDLYVGPHTGGESFGIVLVEAMAAGAPVLASDLPAFVRVLDAGRVGMAGATFTTGRTDELAARIVELLGDPGRRRSLADAGRARARDFDWSVVARDIVTVYETVLDTRRGVRDVTRLRPGQAHHDGWAR